MGLTTINANNIFQKGVIGNVRTEQEDSHDMAVTPNGDVFVVCDGMGGHAGGRLASSIAVKSIIESLNNERNPNPQQALNDALQFANMQVLGHANAHPELSGMGTTACILLLQDDKAYIAHVGDSRIYLYLGKEKQLHRITKDHSYVQSLVDAGEISYEEADKHPYKNRILKALGIKPEMKPSFNAQPILPKNGDIFLICSDGLTDMVSESIMKETLAESTTLEEKGEFLINKAMEEGGVDNTTLQLIQISDSPHKTRSFKSYSPVPVNSAEPETPKGKKNILPFILIGIVVAALAVGGGYWYYNNQSAAMTTEEAKSAEQLSSEFKMAFQQMGDTGAAEEEVYLKQVCSRLNLDTAQNEKKAFIAAQFNEADEARKLQIIKAIKDVLSQPNEAEVTNAEVVDTEKVNAAKVHTGTAKKGTEGAAAQTTKASLTPVEQTEANTKAKKQ